MVAARDDETEYQERYFDVAAHQYPRAAVVTPPIHTLLESQSVLQSLGDLGSDGPIIDFGAGTGRLSIALARAGYPVLAVDVSEKSLDVLTATARDLGLRNIQTASALPSQSRYQAIVGADVLHHVNLDEYLPRMRSVLRDRGKVVFSEPGALNPAWYLYLPVCHELRVEKRLITCSLFQLRRTFERHGFRDIQITGLGLLPRPLFRWRRGVCRCHDAAGNLPVLKWFAYRYVIEACT